MVIERRYGGFHAELLEELRLRRRPDGCGDRERLGLGMLQEEAKDRAPDIA